MKKTDMLFELIKSLDNNEKRYFSLFAQRHTLGERNNYLRLFEIISKQKEYDEKPLLALYKKETASENLRLRRQYLYKLILKSLDNYHADDSVDTQLKRQIHCVKILFRKGLYRHCEKIITKAKPIAVKYEKQLLMLELLNWEKRLIKMQGYSGKPKEKIEKISRQTFQYLAEYKSIHEHDMLSIRLTMKLKQQGFTRSSVEAKKIKSSTKHSILVKKNKTFPFHAKIHLNTYYLSYFKRIKGDVQKAYQYSVQQVQLIENNPHLLAEEKEMYVSALHNLIISQSFLKRYKEMDVSVQKLKSIHTNSKNINHLIFYITSITEITMCIDMGEFERAVHLIPEIEDRILNGSNKEEQIIVYYEFCNAYFGAGEYSKANTYLNKIINEQLDVRNDLQCFSRILSIVIHFELGHADLLEYVVQSTYRFLLKRKRLYKFESIVLNFIRKELPSINSQSQLIHIFKNLKTEITTATKNPFEKNVFDYFDFISWLESKIENRPFAEVVREKAIKA